MAQYARLQRPVQRAVDAVFSKFREHRHVGLHLEKLQEACDERVRTIRVTDFYRGILVSLGHDRYALMCVLPHDDANTYAVNHVFTVNPVLGVIEVHNRLRLEQELERASVSAVSSGLFAGIGDDDLTGLGVESKLLPLVRALTDDTQLDALKGVLPNAQFDVLTGFASGMSVDEVRDELGTRPVSDVDTEDLFAAALRTPERIKFVSGPSELADILSRPFDLWRVFLHPTQYDIANRETYSGPAYVTGSAGTGKTVTGLHRAVFLARRLTGDDKVLITTYTKALAESLTRQLRLLTNDPAVLDRIEVVGVDRLANKIVSDARGVRKLNIADEPLLQRLRDEAAKNSPAHVRGDGSVARFTGAFLQREWEQVILAQGLTTWESYRDASRRGTGVTLRADQRERIWVAVSNMVAELEKLRKHTHLQVAAEAARIAESGGAARYRHLIVDEGQDLQPAQWRLLRALVPPGPNDMFILADPHQRIYDSQVTLANIGIEVRGRSRRLTVNYRTTHEILGWSIRVLSGEKPVGLDGTADSLAGYRSVTRGEPPVVVAYNDREAELDSLIERIGTWLEQGVEPDAIGVAARTNHLATEIARVLRDAHVPVADEATGGKGVYVATMHRMKGLEFQCLAIAGLDRSVLPAVNAVTDAAEDPISHKQDLMRERCLLFVAVTRARDALYLSHSGQPSALLPV